MPSTVEQLNPSRVKLTVEIPFADLQPHLTKAYREIAQTVTIPGFRKGKVPTAVIDQRFGRGMVLQEAINAALPTAYGEAVEANKLIPLGDPDVEITKLEDGDVIEFIAEVDVRPELNLPDFGTLSATVPVLADLDTEVNNRIGMMRERFATSTEVDRAAADGDVVTLDLAGSRDGADLRDATAEGITYTIGSGGMLDGLDEAVTGLAAGQSADFTSTLVGGPLARGPADIHVAAHKGSERELPELADATRTASRHDEPQLLDRLTRLAGQVESQYAATHSRFSASAAYFELVDRRIADIGESRLSGLQTIGEFMDRRLTPARSTCQWATRRQDALSQRVSRMSNLLRTRVEIEQQQSSQALLATMNTRQGLQLKLQSTVEGLSVAAITYYIVGLVAYLAKGAYALGWPWTPESTAALAIPVVAGVGWWSLRRLHHKVFKD